jgi:hypothetical protein
VTDGGIFVSKSEKLIAEVAGSVNILNNSSTTAMSVSVIYLAQ